MSFRATLNATDQCLSTAASCATVDECYSAMCDPRVDWLSLVSLANQHLVAPALWTALSPIEASQLIPDDVCNYLALLHTRNRARNARLYEQCLEIGSILSRGGMKAVLLKGVAWLFDGSSGAASDRMMRDIDLLIAPDRIDDAVQALVGAGYQDTGTDLVEKGHYHHAPLLPPRGEAVVEIHHDLAHRAILLPTHEVITSAKEIAPGLLLPMVRHRIVHNVVHSQIENGDFAGGILNLRDALDLARLTVAGGPETDWVSIADEARERKFFGFLSGVFHAAHRVLHSPLPTPLESGRGKIHAWRCVHQRQWPAASKIAENLGRLTRALAWDRDAYPLKLDTDRSLRAHLLVTKRRVQRAKAAFKGKWQESLTESLHKPTDRQLSAFLIVGNGRTLVLLDWPASNAYGWGICGLNIFMAWANDPNLQPMMGAPINELDLAGYGPERVLALKDAIAESNQIQPNLARFRAVATRVGTPVVKAFGNGLADPGGVSGTPSIARCVFEDTRLENVDDKLANYDVLLCASHWNGDLLKSKTRKRIEVIHEGVDHTLFKPGPKPARFHQNKFYIFSGGKVEFRKGHDLVLLAFKEFSRRHNDVVLVTAWHSPWPQFSVGFKGKLNEPLELAADGTIHVKKWVISNGIDPDKVMEIGQIPNPLLPNLLLDMDCALFPSRAEGGTNLAAKEAMACGIPVILANNTGLKDLTDGDNCIALTKQKPIPDFGTEQWGESDVEEILQALERLYADSSYRHKIGQAGAAWILSNGRTWRNHARELKSLIVSL